LKAAAELRQAREAEGAAAMKEAEAKALSMRQDRERARNNGGNAVALASAAGAGSGASASAVCRVCGQGFATRNKLFKHIALTGHEEEERDAMSGSFISPTYIRGINAGGEDDMANAMGGMFGSMWDAESESEDEESGPTTEKGRQMMRVNEMVADGKISIEQAERMHEDIMSSPDGTPFPSIPTDIGGTKVDAEELEKAQFDFSDMEMPPWLQSGPSIPRGFKRGKADMPEWLSDMSQDY
jgi:hypothetical protein